MDTQMDSTNTEKINLLNTCNLAPRNKSKLEDLISKQLDPADPTPLNTYELRNYIYYGLSNANLRPKYWKVLLNYFSPNKFKSESFYRLSRQTYADIQKSSLKNKGNTEEILDLIQKDLDRTFLLNKETENSLEAYTEPIKRILLTFSLTNSSIGYVQGMINLILPIYYVMDQSKDIEDSKFAEEDTFFLFNNLMSEIGDNFINQMDNSSYGLRNQIGIVFDLIKERDQVLYDELKKKNLLTSGFPLKWILLLFSNEFKMNDVLWLWDRIFSDSYRFEILSYCCAAAIILLRNIILTESFERCMEVLQNPSIIDVEVMFDIADVMRRERHDIIKLINKRVDDLST